MKNRPSVAALAAAYRSRSAAIKKRTAEFRRKLSSPPREIFEEFCFCLLTPQSRAKSCWAAIENLKAKKYLGRDCRVSAQSLARELRGVRFANNKSRYLADARSHFDEICACEKSGVKGLAGASSEEIASFRNALARRVRGYGLKEASHFLRNVGLGRDLAILDRHILKNLVKFGALKEIPGALTPRLYLEIENKMRRFAEKIKIPMDELDLLFWSEETGEIFK